MNKKLLVSQNCPFHPGLQPSSQTPVNLSQLGIQIGPHSCEQFLPYQPEGHAGEKKNKTELILISLQHSFTFPRTYLYHICLHKNPSHILLDKLRLRYDTVLRQSRIHIFLHIAGHTYFRHILLKITCQIIIFF